LDQLSHQPHSTSYQPPARLICWGFFFPTIFSCSPGRFCFCFLFSFSASASLSLVSLDTLTALPFLLAIGHGEAPADLQLESRQLLSYFVFFSIRLFLPFSSFLSLSLSSFFFLFLFHSLPYSPSSLFSYLFFSHEERTADAIYRAEARLRDAFHSVSLSKSLLMATCDHGRYSTRTEWPNDVGISEGSRISHFFLAD